MWIKPESAADIGFSHQVRKVKNRVYNFLQIYETKLWSFNELKRGKIF